jgi:nicotinamidase-related amidase
VQVGFLATMHARREAMLRRLVRLARLAGWLGIPTIATAEEPVSAKGGLPAELAAALPAGCAVHAKRSFDAMAEEGVAAALEALGRRTVAVAGCETDVCVLLTVEGLRRAGYGVHLLEDCVFSSTPDCGPAIARMRAAGAVPTTLKTLAFELTATVDRGAWPAAWREGLAADPTLFPAEDDLAPGF